MQAAIGPNTVGWSWSTSAGYVAPAIRASSASAPTTACGCSRTPRTPTAARLDGQFAGTFGVAGSFSFYPTKVIAGGEGGMFITNDSHFVDEAKIYGRPGQGVVPDQRPHPSRLLTGG